jgi:cellulose biosynthesis protein BcsQ
MLSFCVSVIQVLCLSAFLSLQEFPMPSLPGQPSIIAFISQTGNVMKTTLAAAVGVALGEAGIPTLAIDLDKEHRALGASLETWATERAASHPDRVQLDVRPADTAEEALALARTSGRQIVIIDCPSRATAATAHIAGAADFVVMPLVPGVKDAALTLITIGRIIMAGVSAERLAVVLTRISTEAEARDHQAWIRATPVCGHEVRVIEAVVPERTAYRNAIGKGLTILEAQPVSVRRDARAAVNGIIEAYMAATDGSGAEQELTRGAA